MKFFFLAGRWIIFFIFLLLGCLVFAQDRGEIILTPGIPATSSYQEKKEFKETPVLEKKPAQQAEDPEKAKNYKRKLAVSYIIVLICLFYLLTTYRNRKRRI